MSMAVLPFITNTSTHVCPFVLNSFSGKLCVFNAAQVHMDGTELGWRIGGVSSLKPAGGPGPRRVEGAARGGCSPPGGAHFQEGLTSRGAYIQGAHLQGGLSSRRYSPPGWGSPSGQAHLQERLTSGGLTSRRGSPPGGAHLQEGLTSSPLPSGLHPPPPACSQRD